MKLFYTTLLYCTSLFFMSCEADKIVVDDIISRVTFSKTELVANGSDTSTITVYFRKEISKDKVMLDVEVDNGVFIESEEGGNSLKDISPERNIDNELFVEINLKSTTINAPHNIEFKVGQFTKNENVQSSKSTPASISITSSSFSVQNNFESEIELEGIILNENGAKVSNGTKVIFSDFYADGSPVNGSFRNIKNTSNSESKVSALYSPGIIVPNQFITLMVTVLDENNSSTNIQASIEIYVNEGD